MSKYGNKPVDVPGVGRFDSQGEWRRWSELCSLQAAGKIAGLERQVVFELAPSVFLGGKKRPPLRYKADFVYTNQLGRRVVEDFKGVRTPSYRIKRHLMASVHGIEVRET